jgi:hypothetical protein
MFLLPAAAVVIPLVVVVGLALWLRRHAEDHTLPRWARLLGVNRPGLVGLLAVFDGLRAISLVAVPAVALLFIATVDLTVSRLSLKQEGKRGSRSTQVLGLPLTGGTTTLPGPAASAQVPAPDSTTSPGAPAATSKCHNSSDPSCGPFRWDPPPAPNQPILIAITRTPRVPRVGEQVTVTVHVTEADTEIGGVTVAFGDEEALTLPPANAIACDGAAPAGPWTPPEVARDDTVTTHAHTYARPGDYTIDVYAASADFLDATCPPNPYASQGTASAPIHVGAGTGALPSAGRDIQSLHGAPDPTALVVQHALGVATPIGLQP